MKHTDYMRLWKNENIAIILFNKHIATMWWIENKLYHVLDKVEGNRSIGNRGGKMVEFSKIHGCRRPRTHFCQTSCGWRDTWRILRHRSKFIWTLHMIKL